MVRIREVMVRVGHRLMLAPVKPVKPMPAGMGLVLKARPTLGWRAVI